MRELPAAGHRFRRLPMPGVRANRRCKGDRPGLPPFAQPWPRREARPQRRRCPLRLSAFDDRSPVIDGRRRDHGALKRHTASSVAPQPARDYNFSLNKNRRKSHGVDDSDVGRNLHRPRNQRLSAGRILILRGAGPTQPDARRHGGLLALPHTPNGHGIPAKPAGSASLCAIRASRLS
jgi:hypothetical protein